MKEILDQYLASVNTLDFTKVSKYMHSNAYFCLSDHELTNLEQIKEHHETFWSAIKNGKFWATDVNWLHTDARMLVCSYTVNFSGYIDGSYTEGNEKTTDVFIKDLAGNWKLLLSQCTEKYQS